VPMPISHPVCLRKGYAPRNSFVRELTQQAQILLRIVQVLPVTTRQAALAYRYVTWLRAAD